jgi:hypothetical protein
MAIRDGLLISASRVGQRTREQLGVLSRTESTGLKESVNIPIYDIFKIGDIQQRIRDNAGVYVNAAYTTTADSGYKLPVYISTYDVLHFGERIPASKIGMNLYQCTEKSSGGTEPIQPPRQSPLEIRWKQANHSSFQ